MNNYDIDKFCNGELAIVGETSWYNNVETKR